MKIMTNQSKNVEMVWATRLSPNSMTNMELWHFGSQTRNVQTTIDNKTMTNVDPAGQWVICDFSKTSMTTSTKMIKALQGLTGPECYQLINFHFEQSLPEHREIVRDLWYFQVSLENQILKTFFYNILKDRLFISAFYCAKGSHQHHHNTVGGLLEHSYEVAFNSAVLARRFGLGATTCCIAFIGGLLHDAGKIELYYNQPIDLAICEQHEMLSFMLLKSQLQYLREQSPRYFEAIVGCLKVNVNSVHPSYMAETIVRMVDRLSTEVYHAKQAFQNTPDYYWYTKNPVNNRIYKRLDAY
mgnify:FL=1